MVNKLESLRQDYSYGFSISYFQTVLADRLLAYLAYLSEIQPDLKHQLSIFIKFERHLFKIFKQVHKTPGLHDLKIMIHGDSKVTTVTL